MNKLKKLLNRSLEGDLTPREHERLNEALRRDPGLREEKTRTLEIRRSLARSRASGFEAGFSGRVMTRIREKEESGQSPDVLYEAFMFVFRRVALVGAAALLVMLTYNLSIGDNFSEEEALFASDSTCRELQELPLFWEGGRDDG